MTGLRPLLLLALLLTGCSSGQDAPSPVFQVLKQQAKRIGAPRQKPGPAGTPDISNLSRAALKGVDRPVLLASIEKLGVAATLVFARDNAGYRTYASPDPITVTTRGGVVAATRGLIGDLLSADTDATIAALRARQAATYPRALRWIGGERQVLRFAMTCRMTVAGPQTLTILQVDHATTHMVESCTPANGGAIRNDYWIGADNVVWQSRQYLHPAVGHMTTAQLIP